MDLFIRTYSRATKEKWAKSNPLKDGIFEEFCLSFRSSGGGVSGEFTIECSILSGKEVFRIKAFSDSVKCLLGFSDILLQLEKLANTENIADRIEKILEDNDIVKYSSLPTFFKVVNDA